MTVKELIEELQEIDKKYQDHEVVIYDIGNAKQKYIDSIDNEPNPIGLIDININI